MKELFSMALPWTLSVNRIANWRNKKGVVFTPKEYKEVKKETALLVQKFVKENNLDLFITDGKEHYLQGRFKVDLILFPPNKRQFDVDNRVKPTLDELTYAKLWLDDKYIDEINVRRGGCTENGKIYVKVQEYDESTTPRPEDYGVEPLVKKGKK